MNETKIALVLGATGGAGGEIAQALHRRGWKVRGLVRDAARPGLDPAIEWVTGDAMQAESVMRAAQGASVLVHAVNPPGYRDWDKLVLPMIDHSIAAARRHGARIVLPGTVYNYGPEVLRELREDAPQQPLTRKGAIRVELERRLQAAAEQGVRSLILRCGDFFGPRAGNNWFAAMMKPGRAPRSISYPGQRELPHAWAYLPDVGETVAQLLEREPQLGAFARFHFNGHWVDGNTMAAAIRQASGNDRLAIRAFPWALTALAAPFVTVMREVREMRYLWQQPLRLDNRKLLDLLGAEPHTPLEQAVHTTMAGLGCLKDAAPATQGAQQHA